MKKSKKCLFRDDNDKKIYNNDLVKIEGKTYKVIGRVFKYTDICFLDKDGTMWKFGNQKIEKC